MTTKQSFSFFRSLFETDNLPKECKLIGGVYFIDALPKSTTGKPLHREVKEVAVQRFNAKIKNGH